MKSKNNCDYFKGLMRNHSGKSLPSPTKANMKWYKPEDRVKRDKDIRNKYIRCILVNTEILNGIGLV